MAIVSYEFDIVRRNEHGVMESVPLYDCCAPQPVLVGPDTGGFECCGPKYMDNPALNKAAAAKMRSYQARCFENLASAENSKVPPLPEQMGRWKAMH